MPSPANLKCSCVGSSLSVYPCQRTCPPQQTARSIGHIHIRSLQAGAFYATPVFCQVLFLLFYFFFAITVSHGRCERAAHTSRCRARCVFASVNPRNFCQVFFFKTCLFSRRVPAPTGTTFAWRRAADAVLLLSPHLFCQALFLVAATFFTPPPRIRPSHRLTPPDLFFHRAPSVIPPPVNLRR
ncbi:hypothetical protein U14_04951 [Candidatus Moduliflexus flocculans]|uniref:Uncharacterized protein n=1 Tax=Candidatus Moduliflexus flocculans TaxID=1499966 RepID=A0A081BQJ9_9BACT|nr:hypothetical protein U14_04951 [Candidatus Moduliflexus flocculans]